MLDKILYICIILLSILLYQLLYPNITDNNLNTTEHHQSKKTGWRWINHDMKCNISLVYQSIKYSSNKMILDTFKKCGVIVLSDCINAEEINYMKGILYSKSKILFESRIEFQKILRNAIKYNVNPNMLWEQLKNNSLLSNGFVYRERNPDRIDISLNYNEFSNYLEHNLDKFDDVFNELLGNNYRLKSLHGIIALPNAQDQHWHRDSDLLFSNMKDDDENDVHNYLTGVHLPPFAINMFVPLININEYNGATEFTLSSHLWSEHFSSEEEENAIDKQFELKIGSCLLFDYRTVHRGRKNHSDTKRSLLMLIFSRLWWSDEINYGINYGGKSPKVKFSSIISNEYMNVSEELKFIMFNHLIRLYSPNIIKDLKQQLH